MDRISAFISNVCINSLLTFFTAVLLIETILFLFRVRQGRISSFMRMIPILKLPLDLFCYDFSRWSYMYGINPLACEQGSRSLTAIIGWANSLFMPYMTIEFNVYGTKTFTIADIINHSISSGILHTLSSILLLFSLGLILRKAWVYYSFYTVLQTLRSDNPTDTVVVTPLLKGSPFVSGVFSQVVYIPKSLQQTLTEKEYEAVLEHEKQHLVYKDNLVRLIIDFTCSAFWWIPTKRLRRSIEEGQETACDRNCLRRGVQPFDLASALYKSAKDATANRVPVPSMAQGKIQKRIKMIFSSKERFYLIRLVSGCAALIAAVSIVLFGRFWIF